jgi:hypothetical protein
VPAPPSTGGGGGNYNDCMAQLVRSFLVSSS